MLKFPKIISAALLTAASGIASAGLVASQPFVSGGFELESFVDAPAADTFTLENDATLSSLTWWGTYDSSPLDESEFASFNPADAFSIFFSTADGSPVSAVLTPDEADVSVSYVGDISDSALPIYQYSMNLGIDLLAGDYFLSVANDLVGDTWLWIEGSGDDSVSWSSDPLFDPEWFDVADFDLAFEINAVPEPASLSLVLLGLAAVAGRKKAVRH